MVRGNELVIRPAKTNSGGEFAEQILSDLIARGYIGEDLLAQFKIAQRKMRPAVEEMLAEAKQVTASKSEFATYEDVFGSEEE